MTNPVERRAELAPYEASFGRGATEVLDDLEKLSAMLLKWQSVQNLVSRETLGVIWERHILDSLQILPMIEPQIPAGELELTLLDIGSGGGFPALPLAIALKERPVRFHLVESHGRKCAYLNAVVREFRLPAKVHNARIEALSGFEPDLVSIVTSRALAPLPLLFAYISRFWQPESRAILHKGREYGEELRQADSAWRYDVVKHASRVDPEGVILEITQLERID